MANIKYLLAVCAAMAAASLYPSPVCGQEAVKEGRISPAERERMKMERLWFGNTVNAAGSRIDNTTYYSEFDLGFSYDKGDFTRPQAGTSSRDITFNTEGGGDVGGFYAWGSFSYVNNFTQGTRYNMSVLDPFRGNPFILSDYRASDWYKQMFDLRMQIATPMYCGGKLAFGLDVAYTSDTGAKQVDPRPKIDFYRIRIRPGAVYAIDTHNAVGLNLEYYNLREEANITNNNITETQQVALMRGFGFFSELNFIRDQVFSKGNAVGGALQYSFTGSWQGIVSAGVSRQIESVFQNTTRPLSMGNTDALLYEVKASATIHGKRGDMHALNAFFSHRTLDGIEEVTVQEQTDNGAMENIRVDRNVRSNYKTTAAGLSYDYLHSDSSSDYIWRLGAAVRYEKESDIYYLPESVRDYSNFSAGVNGAYNFMRSGAWQLLVRAEAEYVRNLDGDIRLDVPTPDHQIITGFEIPDFAYLTSDYIRCGLSLTASTALGRNNSSGMYITAAGELLSPTRTTSTLFSTADRRMCLKLSVGFMF